MSKCKGCGITLQSNDKEKSGYTPKEGSKLCERCFKITNYNYHEKESKIIDNNLIIKGINHKKGATLFLCDILNLNSKMMELYDLVNQPKVLVITKSDMIPKNVSINDLKERLKKIYHLEDVLFISTLSGYGKNDLLDYVYEYPKVIFAGPTSSGKSSLINYLFNKKLTVSNHKNTTQEFITLKIENQEIIDAPGFYEDYIIDNIKQNGYINPKTIYVKKGYLLSIGDFQCYADKDVNLTLFLPKGIIIKTCKIKKEFIEELHLNEGSDLIIRNIGFIYFKETTHLKINNASIIDIRRSIVGGK